MPDPDQVWDFDTDPANPDLPLRYLDYSRMRIQMLNVPVHSWVQLGDVWPVPFSEVSGVLERAGIPLTKAGMAGSQAAGAWSWDYLLGDLATACCVMCVRTDNAYLVVPKRRLRRHGLVVPPS